MKSYLLLFLSALIFAVPVYGEVAPALQEDIQSLDDEEDIEVLVWINGSSVGEEDFSYDVEVKESFGVLDTVLLEIESGHAEEIDQNPHIERVGPNYRIKAMLSESRPQINADFRDSYSYNSSNVSIAVMDSGIASHPSLEVTEKVDFTGDGEGDENGHGTHVAGIIASKHGRYRGIAPGSEIHDIKVLDSEGAGRGSEMLAGLNYAVRNDLDVAVLSLGSIVERCNGRDILSRAVDQASRTGLVVVVAAGNQGPEESSITSPGCSREAITVGAVDKSARIAPYSSRGLTADGRVKPDVVAPGSNIASANIDGGFIRRSGTSMAAPHVAGQTAILISSGQRPETVKQRIINSSTDLGYSQSSEGAGMINVQESLNFTDTEIKTSEGNWIETIRAWIRQIWFLY